VNALKHFGLLPRDKKRERERERNRGLKMDKWNNLLRLPKGVCQGLPDFS
jgi:hypothetical protein